MKTLILMLSILISPMFILAQDTLTCPVQNHDIPVEINDDPNIKIVFPGNFIPQTSRGIAIAPVLVDEKGNLVKYCVNVIRIQDTTGNNALIYVDNNMSVDNIHKDSSEIPIEEYPYYTRFIVEEIYKRIKLIHFSSKVVVPSKQVYRFSVIFKIK